MKIRLLKPALFLMALLLIGFTGGVVNGLFGTGGGIILIFFLSKIYAKNKEYNTRDIFAMTVAAIMIMSVNSAFLYYKNGYMDFQSVSPFLLPAVIGGIAGAFILDRLDVTILKKIFALLVIYAGITLIFRN